MDGLAASLRLLAEPTRLRVLRLLAREELNAGDLARVLGRGQPAVSRQLGLLREAGLLDERRDGRYVFYSLCEPAACAGNAAAWVLGQIAEAPDDHGDLARLEDLRRARRERALADAPEGQRNFVPGRSWRAWARVMSALVPRVRRAVDLGCGEGALTLEIARMAEDVLGIDHRPAALRRARSLAKRRGVAHVRFAEGDVCCTGLRKGSFDLAFLSQTLHFADDPLAPLTEARRLLRPAGRVAVLDLYRHTESWVCEKLGHRRLGFTPAELTGWLRDAGFADVRTERMPARADDPFQVLIATGGAPVPARRKTR